MKKISFIIPVYNVNIDDLKSCVQSILVQNFDEYEIIIINDGSKDEQLDVVCRKMQVDNANIKYIFQRNSGSAVARNSGLAIADGDYIMFVDADDMLATNFKDDLYSNAKGLDSFNFIAFDYSFWDTENEDIQTLKYKTDFAKQKNDVLANILFYPNKLNDFMFGSIWAKVFSKVFLDKYNIRFKPELRKAQDRRFMLDVVYKSDEILYLPIYSYKYRTNNNSICHKMNYNMIEYYERLYSSIMEFRNNTNINEEVFKFLEYNIVNEIIPLCIFHIDNKQAYSIKRKEIIKLFEKYKIKDKVKKIRIAEMPSLKSKIKLFLYKSKAIFLLYMFFIYKQKKIVKNSFNKG